MTEKEINAGYEILQAVSVGPYEIVLGENLNAASPYVTWLRGNGSDGQKRYDWGYYCSTYKKALVNLGQRVSEYANKLPEPREGTRDSFYREDSCMANSTQYMNSILAIRPECLMLKCRLPEYQLFFATSDEGCGSPAGNGFVKCIRLADRMEMELRRDAFFGVVHPTLLPQWALNTGKHILDSIQNAEKTQRRKAKSPIR